MGWAVVLAMVLLMVSFAAGGFAMLFIGLKLLVTNASARRTPACANSAMDSKRDSAPGSRTTDSPSDGTAIALRSQSSA